MLNLNTLTRAKDAPYLNAARNGKTGSRKRKSRSIRLPKEVWEDVDAAAKQLHVFFPERYVTSNSALEFLIHEGLRSLYAQQ